MSWEKNAQSSQPIPPAPTISIFALDILLNDFSPNTRAIWLSLNVVMMVGEEEVGEQRR